MKIINSLTWMLAFIGAINLILVAFNIDLIVDFFESKNLVKLVRILIGISALYQLTK